MSRPEWWDRMAEQAEALGHPRFSAGWYAAMRDMHREQFPNADARSQQNMDDLARDAETRESAIEFGGSAHDSFIAFCMMQSAGLADA